MSSQFSLLSTHCTFALQVRVVFCSYRFYFFPAHISVTVPVSWLNRRVYDFYSVVFEECLKIGYHMWILELEWELYENIYQEGIRPSNSYHPALSKNSSSSQMIRSILNSQKSYVFRQRDGWEWNIFLKWIELCDYWWKAMYSCILYHCAYPLHSFCTLYQLWTQEGRRLRNHYIKDCWLVIKL